MRKAGPILALSLLIVAGVVLWNGRLDRHLRRMIDAQGITGLELGPPRRPELVTLGEVLFFDKELSGNRDIACATCHHPTQGSGDGLAVSIGTGGIGLGPERQKRDDRHFIPRNAPELFNRGAVGWRTMFWDSRVALNPDGGFTTPAGDLLPPGLDSVLAAQAMFPVTSRDEMRGPAGDQDRYGNPNELAMIEDGDLPAIWDGLMARLRRHPGYLELFRAAYPDVLAEDLAFQHAANAIAAYEAATFALADSQWARYLEGDNGAMADEAKKGALLFFGEARCAQCHAGPLFTDQEHHVLASPQVGPGKGDEAPSDLGRMRETGQEGDRYAFRTPPLLNVAVSGPWLHDGAYSTLEAVVRHHLDPAVALRSYNPSEHLQARFRNTFQASDPLLADMIAHLDPILKQPISLSDDEIDHLVAFLESLTDPACTEMPDLVPAAVPSGLPVTEERTMP